MSKLLLHSCCAGCAAYLIKKLVEQYDLTVYFYNPNIFPKEEYEKRLVEVKSFCEKNKIDFFEEKEEYENWKKMISGLENEPEKGKRCEKCIYNRLEKTSNFAKDNNYEYFATTLTISPHKNADFINKTGKELAEKNKVKFLAEVWRKKNGFLESCALSKEHGFYRQEYCGCEYSNKIPNHKSQ